MLPTKKSNYAVEMTQKHKHIFKERKLSVLLFDNSWIVFSMLLHLWLCKGRAAQKSCRWVIQQNVLIYGLWGFWMSSPCLASRNCYPGSLQRQHKLLCTGGSGCSPAQPWVPLLPAEFAPLAVLAEPLCWGDSFCIARAARVRYCLGSLSLVLGKVSGGQGRSTAIQHRASYSNGALKESPVSPEHHFRSIVRAWERQ